MVVEHAVVVDRPLDEVWAVFDDPKLQLEWDDNLLTYEQIEGKGNSEGAVQQLTYKRGDGETVLTATVLERSTKKLMVTRYEGMQLPFTITSTFRAIDDDSSEWHAEIEVKLSLLTKALGAVLKGPMTEMAQNMGDGFKKYVESR
ncbi:MAG: SRPBCC family protein [Solirubrobacterales bacterium]